MEGSNKPEKEINIWAILEELYPTIVLLTATIRANIGNIVPRSVFLGIQIVPASLLSLLIIYHHRGDIAGFVKEIRSTKEFSIIDLIPIICLLEINMVTIYGILKGRTVLARAVDVPYYDLLLFTGIVMALFMSEEQKDRMLKNLAVLIFISAIFLFGEIIYIHHTVGGDKRPQGIFRNGFASAAILISGLWLPVYGKKMGIRLAYIGLCVVDVILALNRSMWLGLFFSVMMFIVWNSKSIKERIGKWFSARNVFIGIGVIFGFVIILYFSGYLSVLMTRFNFSNHAILGRMGFTAEALRYFVYDDTWFGRLFGHGRDTVEAFMKSWKGLDDIIDGKYYGLHNQYMTVLYEFGIVGLVGMLYIFVYSLKSAKHLSGAGKEMGFFVISLIIPCLLEDVGEYTTTPFVSFLIAVIAITMYRIGSKGESKQIKEKKAACY